MGLRVLVCGGRSFKDEELVARALRQLGPTCIVHGGASGADTLAERWAQRHTVPTFVCKANWSHLGPAAGPIRNQEMLDHFRPDIVVAFPGGRGTADMVTRATKEGIRVLNVKAEQAPKEAGK